jgi:hypothetical protein
MEQPRQPESPTSTIGADDENKNVTAFTHLFGMKQEKVFHHLEFAVRGPTLGFYKSPKVLAKNLAF